MVVNIWWGNQQLYLHRIDTNQIDYVLNIFTENNIHETRRDFLTRSRRYQFSFILLTNKTAFHYTPEKMSENVVYSDILLTQISSRLQTKAEIA